MPTADRTPRKVDDSRAAPDFRGALAAGFIGMVLFVGGILWIGVTATNTATAPGYYYNDALYYRIGDGKERSVDAVGEADTNTAQTDHRIRVYYDTKNPDEPMIGWYRIWLAPGALLVIGAGGLMLAAGMANRAFTRSWERAMPVPATS